MVRLYRLGYSQYEQHREGDELPESIVSFLARSRGEMPPYIPLPEGTVTFRIAPEGCGGREVLWISDDPLPEPVLQYVCENGVLPQRTGSVESIVAD